MLAFPSVAVEVISGNCIPLKGEIHPPGDKSISHRAVILGSLAEGVTLVKGFLFADDTLRTLRAMEMMGVSIESHGEELKILEIKGK